MTNVKRRWRYSANYSQQTER